MRVRNLPDSLLFRNVVGAIVPDLIILAVWTGVWDWTLVGNDFLLSCFIANSLDLTHVIL
jgi:hypothetical protein